MLDSLRLPTVIKEHLEASGTSRQEFVRHLGYRNLAKGLRRLDAWLRGHAQPEGDQSGRLCAALDILDHELESLVKTDQRALLDDARRRRQKDPSYRLTLRFFAGCYGTRVLPRDLDDEQALELAREEARDKNLRCCLDTPDNRQYWLSTTGEIEVVTEAAGRSMSIGGKRFLLQID